MSDKAGVALVLFWGVAIGIVLSLFGSSFAGLYETLRERTVRNASRIADLEAKVEAVIKETKK